jgi:hypothetical protein
MKQLDHQFKNSWQEVEYGTISLTAEGVEPVQVNVGNYSNYSDLDGESAVGGYRRLFSFSSEINHFIWSAD